MQKLATKHPSIRAGKGEGTTVLWLHFGMPKTGSTALQSFMSGNHAALDAAGLRYLVAGRARPDGSGQPTSSHNQVVFDITRGGPNAEHYEQAMREEFMAHRDKTCIVSSEMFYGTRHAQLAKIFSGIPPKEMRILLYCRRYDDYFEAEYKQHAKNGKIRQGATPHIKARLEQVKTEPDKFNFNGRVKRIQEAFPEVEIVTAVYDRGRLTNGNLVDDVLERTGVTCPDDLSTDTQSNPSLSRIGSEAFGVVTRIIGRQPSRRLRRMIADNPDMQRKNDVLELDEREFIMEHLTKSDAEFRETHFGDDPEGQTALFEPRTPNEAMVTYRRDTPQDLEDMKVAMEAIMRLTIKVDPDVMQPLPPRVARRRRARAKARAQAAE